MAEHLKNRECGQVILLSLVIMIILTLAALFLFDLQLTIRSKMKVETAEQAAALAAAEWQRNSLNLIGELNLIKACDAMLQDYEPVDIPAQADRTIAACRTLTEMQSRISFVGPMIAFGAAQQAAKYNGINIFDDYGKRKKKPIDADIAQHIDKLDPDDSTYARWGDYINHYKWKEPYRSLLTDIRERGLAVRPSGIPYMTRVYPSWLKKEEVYDICYNLKKGGKIGCPVGYLMDLGILDRYESFWDGDWWRKISYQVSSFPNQSEIYLLYVGFSFTKDTVDTATIDLKARLESTFGGCSLDEDPDLKNFIWCVYNGEWEPEYLDDMEFFASRFLRDELKPSAIYQGALAMAMTYERIPTISKHKITTAKNEKQAKDVLKRRDTIDSTIIKKVDESEPPTLVGSDSEGGGSVARPVGQLNDAPPHHSSMVLPVFHNTSLLPRTIFPVTSFRSERTNLDKFLIWLDGLNDTEGKAAFDKDESDSQPTTLPEGTEEYYKALKWLSKPENRKSIFNPDFNELDRPHNDYFRDDYKYNLGNNWGDNWVDDAPVNPEGAGWLQQAYIGDGPLPNDKHGLVAFDENDREITNFPKGTRFLLYRKDDSGSRIGRPLTNREYCKYWRIPGTGGGYPRGQSGLPGRG